MGGFHDILSKVVSSIRRFVDHDIWSMRRLGDYDVWLTTTYRLKFVELRRNSVENVPELILVFLLLLLLFFFYYYYLQSKSTVAGGIDCFSGCEKCDIFTCPLGLS